MDKKIIAPLVIVFIVSLLIGFVSGKTYEQENCQTKTSHLKEEMSWLESQLEFFYPPLPQEVNSISGTVVELENDYLVLEAHVRVSQFPRPEGKEIEVQKIKVNLTEETEFFKREFVDAPLVGPDNEPVDLFRKEVLSSESLEIGRYVVVSSEENIRNKKEFTASEVELF